VFLVLFQRLRRLTGRLKEAKVQQLSPSHAPQRNLSHLSIPVCNVLKQVALAKRAFSNTSQLHINDYSAILQMQVHVLSEKRFSAV
jgi:hypothetical protein